MEYTPGPWKIEQKQRTKGGWRAYVWTDEAWPGNKFIAEVAEPWHGDLEGNANLVATAPEMYEILKTLVGCDNCNYERDTMRNEGYFDRAREVLAKAERR